VRDCLDVALSQCDVKQIPKSNGTCLHASVLLKHLFDANALTRSTVIRGGHGKENQGILGIDGNWQGHYWVHAISNDGNQLILDITADQFGYPKVVVSPVADSMHMYRAGRQHEVDISAFEIATELGIENFKNV
jgi:hypothetical protein